MIRLRAVTVRGVIYALGCQNLINLPVEFVYGQRDVNTPPEQPQLFARMLKFAGAKPEMISLRGFDTDHNIALPKYDWATTREWMLQQRRIPAEERTQIILRPPTLRYARSGWLSLGKPSNYALVPEVNASWQRLELSDEELQVQGFSVGSQPMVMQVQTANTEAFALAPCL